MSKDHGSTQKTHLSDTCKKVKLIKLLRKIMNSHCHLEMEKEQAGNSALSQDSTDTRDKTSQFKRTKSSQENERIVENGLK